MGLMSLLKRKPVANLPAKRGYAGAVVSNLMAKWALAPVSINQTINNDLLALRARSRDLVMNNPYAARFMGMLQANVVGEKGLVFQPMTLDKQGNIDKRDNATLQAAWHEWCLASNCSTDGRHNFVGLQKAAVEGMARDGECFVRLHRDSKHMFGLKIELIDPDRIDIKLNEELKSGNRIHMGVEFDSVGAPQAYYVAVGLQAPNAVFIGTSRYMRITASDVIHLGKIDRPGQVRFVPWLAPVMTKLKQLDGYIEAEIVAARIGAAKMGFFSSPDGTAAGVADEETDQGEFIMEADPGTFGVLPEGYSLQTFDPQHPAGNFGDFIKGCLRSIASGLNVSYNSLASDLEGVSFSSIRSGTLEERDQWRTHQAYLADYFCMPIYRAWLEMALLTGDLQLPIEMKSKFNRVQFRPRGFAWVDPLKDIKAAAEGVALGVTTRTEICSRHGMEFEDVAQQLAVEKELMTKLGIENMLRPEPLTPKEEEDD